MMSETPRTDVAIHHTKTTPNVWGFKEHDRKEEFVEAWFARQLERELAAATKATAARCVEAERDAQRYRWLRARWDANTDEDIEQHADAMNADDPDAFIDEAMKK